jgi:ABC-type phosphate transport system substrate-binding protein
LRRFLTMFKALHKRHKRWAVAAGVLAVSAMMVGTAVPAEAASSPAQDTIMFQGGSDTTYTMMSQLAELFNTTPGCNPLITATSGQPLNYGCPANAQENAENGFIINYASLNPYNDVLVEYPALGSSNGINELLDNGNANSGSGIPAAPENLARSSRAPKPTDLGLEFVAYAADAVPWFHLTEYNGKPTASAKVTNLTLTDLEGIYNGTITNWDKVGGANAQIDCYMAQNGSGTEATWQTDLNLSSADPSCLNASGEEASTGGLATHVAFENQDNTIFTNGDGYDAIYFFSYGKFSLLCPTVGKKKKAKTVCAGTPTADQTNSSAALGQINGTPASEATIENGSFATDRLLYNVYENGNTNNADAVPVASQSVLNAISSVGFLCNPASQADVDPLSPTAQTYQTEIDGIIRANGFFPLTEGSEGDGTVTGSVVPWTSSSSSTEAQITDNTVTYAGNSVTNPFYTGDVSPSNSPASNGDLGYCRVLEGS